MLSYFKFHTDEIEDKNLCKYAIVCYDKDNDYYGYFETSDDLEELKTKLPLYKEAIHNDLIRRKGHGEPYDWAFIEETATQKQIIGSWEI